MFGRAVVPAAMISCGRNKQVYLQRNEARTLRCLAATRFLVPRASAVLGFALAELPKTLHAMPV
jgi:hypothetical protein